MGCRKRLFNLINDLPTVFDVVTGKKLVKEKSTNNSNNNNNSSGGTKAKPAAKMVSQQSFAWLGGCVDWHSVFRGQQACVDGAVGC